MVWRDDGVDVAALAAEGVRPRGKGKQALGKAAVAALTDWLRQAQDVESAMALGFAVGPPGRN